MKRIELPEKDDVIVDMNAKKFFNVIEADLESARVYDTNVNNANLRYNLCDMYWNARLRAFIHPSGKT